MAENDLRTTMRFGNLVVTVEPVFSTTTSETAVDKIKKLLLQHVFYEAKPEKDEQK